MVVGRCGSRRPLLWAGKLAGRGWTDTSEPDLLQYLQVPAQKTEITEIVTGLAMLGADSLDEALRSRPAELHHVDDAVWDGLVSAWHARAFEQEFLAAWNNGRAFLASPDGLRGRRPLVIEWKGPHRDPGDVVVPADLRVDHVYLVSCKYLSQVLHNASPWVLFVDHLRTTSAPRSTGDWFDEVAPVQHQELYRLVVQHYASDLGLPVSVRDLDSTQRKELRGRIPRDWSPACVAAYSALCRRAAEESATRWSGSLGSERARRSMLWRLLRLGPAPYFVLGTSRSSVLRLRVDTPWDFAQRYKVKRLEFDAPPAGQAVVSWRAEVAPVTPAPGSTEAVGTQRRTAQTGDPGRADPGDHLVVAGHVELRWSHGRFGGHPEAKVYLDTPHAAVPGYVPLG